MRIDIITVLPELLESPFSHSILKRAKDKGLLEVHLHNLRDYSTLPRAQVDDYQFGGGAGMVMMMEPLVNAIESLQAKTTYDEVIYLTPDAPPQAGTSFYRLRLPNGALSGNICPPPHANLREALGITGLPLQAWSEELSVPNVFNQILLYRADLVHSASGYFGIEPQARRMTAVFFWMAA